MGFRDLAPQFVFLAGFLPGSRLVVRLYRVCGVFIGLTGLCTAHRVYGVYRVKRFGFGFYDLEVFFGGAKRLRIVCCKQVTGCMGFTGLIGSKGLGFSLHQGVFCEFKVRSRK